MTTTLSITVPAAEKNRPLAPTSATNAANLFATGWQKTGSGKMKGAQTGKKAQEAALDGRWSYFPGSAFGETTEKHKCPQAIESSQSVPKNRRAVGKAHNNLLEPFQPVSKRQE